MNVYLTPKLSKVTLKYIESVDSSNEGGYILLQKKGEVGKILEE